jgi:N-methylhydantoinase A
VSATGTLPGAELKELPTGGRSEDAIVGRQDVDIEGLRHTCPVYDRARLNAAAKLQGPAIVTQLDSTTVLFPGQAAEVDRYGSLVIQER